MSWLTEKPQLLGWQPSIYWLWSSPGMLVGVDSLGSLIIVRMGTDGGVAPDPFEKSAADFKSAASDWSAEAVRSEWLKRLKADQFEGNELRQFQRAYCTCIGPLSLCRSYHDKVTRRLKRRAASGNPSPVFFGLIASLRLDFCLSREAHKSLVSLQKQAGDERVGLRVISAKLGSRVVRVKCQTPESLQRSRVTNTFH